MDKQLREDLMKLLRSYGWPDLRQIEALESYINDNYVSKDKVRGLKMEEVFEQSKFEDGYNQAVSEINTAIDTLVSVPTPESEKNL